jgi:hypothetical protein
MAFPRRLLPSARLTLALVLAGCAALAGHAAIFDLPDSLTGQEFWRLSEASSEPNDNFQSDNLLSNELVFARTVPALIEKTKPGGVYLGVGPEQNFTYIAAMKPRMVFITDIRRDNLHLHLMYKALFELSADRAEFVSRLFTKPRPAGLTTSSTVTEIMNAYWEATTSNETTYAANLKAIHDHLTRTRSIPLSAADLDGVARVYRAFYWYGPAMTYSANLALTASTQSRGSTYWDIVTQVDQNGQGLSYLGSEEKFAILKDLHRRNLIVPVVGNFSGPKALRAIGAYLKSRGATVTAFYVSNVEGYLQRNDTWKHFCANVATLPLDDSSVFIRPSGALLFRSQTAAGTPPVVLNGVYFFNYGRGSGPATGGIVPILPDIKPCTGSGGLR